MVRRLGNARRQAPKESLQNEKSSHRRADPNAGPIGSKKSPGAQNTAELCRLWSKANRESIVGKTLAAIIGNAPTPTISQLHVETITASWKTRLRPSTRYLYAAELKRLLRFLGRTDLTVPKHRPGKNHPPIAQPGEIERLAAVSPPWLRCLITIAAQTGMRSGDCRKLAPIHCDAELTTIRMQQGKTNLTVTLPISPDLKATLQHAPHRETDTAETPYAHRYHGGTVTRTALQHAWSRARKLAGINPLLTPHSLRHTMAVSLYEVSKDLRLVQQVLGHANLSTTALYLEHLDPTRMREVIQQLWIPKGPVQ